ncbi:hypothetical protein RS030_243559 [Cryptosporidium xiaoi]|uniref:Translation initiation factor eIF2B subunit epsilon n=1 Tax=Cryptosporidium xiaoi TaxID=659607 RepID=A0AAV9XWD4_9CRYT
MDKKTNSSTKGSSGGKNELEFATIPAVVFVESFGKDAFSPLTCEFPELMLPVNGVPMLNYTLEMLRKNGVTEVYLVTYRYKDLLSDYICKYEHENKKKIKSMSINIIQTGLNCTTFGDALRELDFQIDLRDDFILIQGNVLCVADLKELIQNHKKKRQNTPNITMTLLFMESPPLSSLRDENDEKVVIYDSKTDELIYWNEFKDNKLSQSIYLSMKTFLRNSSCSKSVIRYDLLDVGISICSPQILRVFCETFDYNDLFKDYILNSLITDIKQDVIHISILNQYAIKISNLRTYHIALQNICQGWLFPLITDYSSTSCNNIQRYQGFNVFLGEKVSISEKSKLTPTVSIGKGSKIGDGTNIEDSFVGENCIIGANCSIKGCIILDNVKIFDNSSIECSFIGNNVVINACVTVEPYCVFGSNVIINENSVVANFTRMSRYVPKINDDKISTRLEKNGLDSDESQVGSDNTTRLEVGRNYKLLSDDYKGELNNNNTLSPNAIIWPVECRNYYNSIDKILSKIVLFDQLSATDQTKKKKSKSQVYSSSDNDYIINSSDNSSDSNCGNDEDSDYDGYLCSEDEESNSEVDFEKLSLNCGTKYGNFENTDNRANRDDKEFMHECYSLVKSGLDNPIHISNKILELKGLRFAFFKDDLDILNVIISFSLDCIYKDSKYFIIEESANNNININKLSQYCDKSGIKELINAFNRYENEEYTCLICNKILTYSSNNNDSDCHIKFGSLLVSFEKLEFINQSFILDWYDAVLDAEIKTNNSKLISLLESDFVVKYIEWLREDE